MRRVLAAIALAACLSPALTGATEAVPAKPKHHLKADAKEIGKSDRFVAYGKVSTYVGKKVRILRNVRGGEFELYKRVRTSDNGRFRVGIGQVGDKRTCFRLEVPKTADHRRTTKDFACIVTV